LRVSNDRRTCENLLRVCFKPLYMNASNGKHRINVEEKKARSELNRPRSASRGGIRPTGYGRGADSFGRGGARPAGPTS